ncbi:MAG: hypothetical protein EDM05_052970 [Leptolyngbya sp. IPPAS B-1204]
MPKSRKLEELQAQLNQIRAEPTTDEAIAVLRQILASKHNIAIAQAARIIRDADLRELMPDLVTAFNRLMQNPATADPNCLGKKQLRKRCITWSIPRSPYFSAAFTMCKWNPFGAVRWIRLPDCGPLVRLAWCG